MSKKRIFPEYKQLDLQKIASEIADFWKNHHIFQKSVEQRTNAPSFVFYEGPPSANGMPGIHHVMARAIKDIFCRYQTQKGKKVIRKAGWDTHGLPIELGVEKELGISKEDIGKKISVQEYNTACKKAVMRYTQSWNELTEKIGYWVDLEHPYITYDSKYMESVWWLLKEIYSKGLLYKGYTIQPYSPKAGTGLSSHELNMPGCYREVSDTSVVAQFKAKKEGTFLEKFTKEVFFLAWTTTPWTLPSNTALTVGAKIIYVLVETFNPYTHLPQIVVLAKDLLPKIFDKKFLLTEETADFDNFSPENKTIPYRILDEVIGTDLVGITYEQLLPWALPIDSPEKAFRVIDGDFVTTEDGTGIVHTAPTFGADDQKVALQHGVPPMLVLNEKGEKVPLVNLQGKFIDALPSPFGGMYVKNEYYPAGKAPEKSVDIEIAILLKTQNKAFKVEKYPHSYPHCWRTDTPILYYPLDSWFIKVTAIKDRLVELNKTINWKPKSTGEGRFGNWLENLNDWNLSRSRYWGIPLPIWVSEDKSEVKVIGSFKELIEEIEFSISKGNMLKNPYKEFKVGDFSEENYQKIDVHKPFVDEIVLSTSDGKPMYRESDLIDVWFDSGAMPYAQWHYPFENKDLIDNQLAFPADFIAEGVDQTRGWFYTLHAIAGLVFDSIAFKNVVSNGLVLDKNGQKMSKRLGNAVDPFQTIENFGPDATRWYMIGNANPWENLKFDVDGIEEVKRKFFGTLYNTYAFFALYANVDGFTYQEDEIPLNERTELDQWILSELHSLILKVDEAYSDYEPTKVVRLLNTFVIDHLSNWYVRLNRRRFWKGEYTNDKVAAYQTLYECLEKVAMLMAPIAPFYAERLFLDLNTITKRNSSSSVHLSDFPVANKSWIQPALEEKTELAQRITSLVFSIRKKENLKVRQPLSRLMIPYHSEDEKKLLLSIKDIVLSETNIKHLELLNPQKASEVIMKQVKPNFKILGPKLGDKIKVVSQKLSALTPEQIQDFESKGSIEIEGVSIQLNEVEILTKDITGWSVASDGKITLALDIQLNEELIHEGIAREFVNRIQNLRKNKDLDVTDKIQLVFEPDIPFKEAIEKFKSYISNETLAINITFEELNGNHEIIEINDQNIKINLKKL